MKKSVIGFLALGIFVLGLSGCKGKKAESGKEVIRVAVEGTWKPYNYVDENGVLTVNHFLEYLQNFDYFSYHFQ